MLGSILETSDLLQITGYQKAGEAARCLRNQGIKVFNGKNGPWTTLALVNAAGGVTPAPNTDVENYSPEEVF